jgi:hypothetical protein
MSFARFNEFATTNNGVEGDEDKASANGNGFMQLLMQS